MSITIRLKLGTKARRQQVELLLRKALCNINVVVIITALNFPLGGLEAPFGRGKTGISGSFESGHEFVELSLKLSEWFCRSNEGRLPKTILQVFEFR